MMRIPSVKLLICFFILFEVNIFAGNSDSLFFYSKNGSFLFSKVSPPTVSLELLVKQNITSERSKEVNFVFYKKGLYGNLFDKQSGKWIVDSIISIKQFNQKLLINRNFSWIKLKDDRRIEQIKTVGEFDLVKPANKVLVYDARFKQKSVFYYKNFHFIDSDNIIFEFDSKKYLKNIHLNAVSELPYFEKFEKFGDSLLLVVDKNNNKGIINFNGEILIPVDFYKIVPDTLNYFKLTKQKNGMLFEGICNQSGRFIISPIYNEIKPFKNGLYPVKSSKKWSFINFKGEEMIRPFYDDVKQFRNEFCAVKKDNFWGIIDKAGSWVQFPSYNNIYMFNDSIWIWEKEYGMGFFNLNTKRAISQNYDELVPLSENFIKVKFKDKYGVLDINMKTIIKPEFDDVKYFKEEQIFIASKNNYYSIFYTNGNLKVFMNYPFSRFDAYKEGMALVVQKGKFGFIDKDGLLMVSTQYDEARAFNNQISAIRIGNIWGYISSKEKFLAFPHYDEVADFSTFAAAVRKNKLWGIVNREGKETIAPQYEDIKILPSGNFIVKRNGKVGLVNAKGIEIISPVYNYIEELKENVFKVRMINSYQLIDNQINKLVNDSFSDIEYDKKLDVFIFTKTFEWQPY